MQFDILIYKIYYRITGINKTYDDQKINVLEKNICNYIDNKFRFDFLNIF